MNRLKFERLKRGLRQQDIENAVGIKKYRLSLAEAGAQVLNAEEMQRIAEFLGVEPNYLLDEVVFPKGAL